MHLVGRVGVCSLSRKPYFTRISLQYKERYTTIIKHNALLQMMHTGAWYGGSCAREIYI